MKRLGVGSLLAGSAVVAIVGLLAYGVLTQAPDRSIDDALASGRSVPAPAFSLPLLQRGRPPRRTHDALANGTLGLGELRGTPVVLNFWASWCTPCREEAPVLERAWRRDARPKGVLVLGLAMLDVSDDARAFLEEFGITYPNVRDPSRDVAAGYGVPALPETFFITAQGRIVGHVIGVATPSQLRSGIAAARSGRVVGSKQGGARRSTS